MTDDIVKHLQDAAWCKHYNDGGNNPSGKLMEEAADEITRLRAENETLCRDVKTAVMGDSAELQDVKRENEKLRRRIHLFKNTRNEHVFGKLVKANEEIHKLRALLTELADEYEQFAYEGAETALLKEARAAAAAIRESGDE